MPRGKFESLFSLTEDRRSVATDYLLLTDDSWFTHALDKVMDPRTPVPYWAAEELQRLLQDFGFNVHRHLMVDLLPYPHVLYVCERKRE